MGKCMGRNGPAMKIRVEISNFGRFEFKNEEGAAVVTEVLVGLSLDRFIVLSANRCRHLGKRLLILS